MGWLDKYQNSGPTDPPIQELSGPTIRGKQYPPGTIVTNDKNDPRLQTYQDSLYFHDKTEKFESIKDYYKAREYYKTISHDARIWGSGTDKHNPSKFIRFKDPAGLLDDIYPYQAKPTQPVIFEESISPMKPKGLPTFQSSQPESLIQPDVIQFDPMNHAAYKGIDVSHFTDEQGRWTAKLNKVTTPGVKGRLGTMYKNGGIVNRWLDKYND